MVDILYFLRTIMDMDRRGEASEIVLKAEQAVRDLLLRVVSEGDYDLAAILMGWARQLRDMGERIADSSCVSTASLEPRPSPPLNTDGRAGNTTAHRKAPSAGRKAKKPAQPGKADYPRFYRERDELVKIGWSKKRRAEYRHKAPWPIVQKVVQVIEEKGTRGTMFLLEDLLPVTNQDGSEIPSYQVYLVFAWLKQEHLIIQHGRRGYTLVPAINLMKNVEQNWRILL